LQKTVAVEGVQYFGLHGGERYGKPFSLHRDTLRALHHAKHSVQSQLEDLRGVFVEDKGIGFAVHYRQARPATVQAANKVLVNILAPLRDTLRVLNGELVWEILPTEMPGKGPTVQMLLAKLPAGTLAVCLGNDDTDEAAFRALADQITVRVGERCRTNAKFYLRNPAEVWRFLSRFEKELP
jgi:trehalose-phosphatase